MTVYLKAQQYYEKHSGEYDFVIDEINRETLLDEMITTLMDKKIDMGFALIGPRRVGKTSILKEISRRLANKRDTVVIYFSIWDLVENNLREFSQQLIKTLLSGFKGKFSVKYKLKSLLKVPIEKIYEFLKTAGVSIKILDDIEIELRRKDRPLDANMLIERIFALTEELAGEFSVRVILIIDEFPSLIDLTNGKKLGEGIIRKIRTIHETLQNTILCISGSIRKTMEIVALSSSSAFYRQFIIKKVEPFDELMTGELLKRNLRQKITNPAIAVAYNLTRGMPFYLQLLGRQLERTTTELIEPEVIEGVFREILEEEGNIIFNEEFYRLPDKERAALRAMVEIESGKLSEISRKLEEGANVVSKYLEYLIVKGIVEKEGRGIYKISDPVFGEWVRRKFR